MTLQAGIRQLRLTLDLSQEALAHKVGASFRTINRFEGDHPPKGGWLITFAELARECHRADLEELFRRSFIEQSGLSRTGSWLTWTGSKGQGFLMASLGSQEVLQFAVEFYLILEHLHGTAALPDKPVLQFPKSVQAFLAGMGGTKTSKGKGTKRRP